MNSSWQPLEHFEEDPSAKSKWVCGLVADIQIATRIAHAAKVCRAGVHNFDRAERLAADVRQKTPSLIILDLDRCEAEAFKCLNEMRRDVDLQRVPVIGYASQSKREVKGEAERAGCHRVYTKTEFMRDLEMILARYVK